MVDELLQVQDEGTPEDPEAAKEPEGQAGAPEAEPEPEGLTDRHGQPAIARGKYERDMAAKDAEIAKLTAQVEEMSKTEDGRRELLERIARLEQGGAATFARALPAHGFIRCDPLRLAPSGARAETPRGCGTIRMGLILRTGRSDGAPTAIGCAPIATPSRTRWPHAGASAPDGPMRTCWAHPTAPCEPAIAPDGPMRKVARTRRRYARGTAANAALGPSFGKVG